MILEAAQKPQPVKISSYYPCNSLAATVSQSMRTRSSQEARTVSQSQLAAAMPTVAEQPQPITLSSHQSSQAQPV